MRTNIEQASREHCETIARNGKRAPEQLALEYNDRWQDAIAWRRILEEINRVVDFVGFKQVVYDLNTTRTTLSNALAGRDRHYIKAEWLPYFVRRDNTAGLASALASPGGFGVSPRRPLTDREKFERLREVVDRLPDSVRCALYQDAFGEEP